MDGGVTSRDRVLTSLRHEEPDRVPVDFLATPEIWARLVDELRPDTTGIGGTEFMEPEREAVLRHFEVDMRVLCDRAYSVFSTEAQARGIDLGLAIDGDAVLVTDGDRVFQIVSNLLTNAIQWTPPGGTVELALTIGDDKVTVTVTDTGPGIAPDERERIFRPFWSGHGGHTGGTGLGLAIASELAAALGGRLDVHSKPGAGSRFVLVLPREVQPA